MAKDISRPKVISDEESTFLDTAAARQGISIAALVDRQLTALVEQAKKEAVHRWWDTLTLDQKVALYNANK